MSNTNKPLTAEEMATVQYNKDIEGWHPEYWPDSSRIEFAAKIAEQYAAQQTAAQQTAAQQTAALREELETIKACRPLPIDTNFLTRFKYNPYYQQIEWAYMEGLKGALGWKKAYENKVGELAEINTELEAVKKERDDFKTSNAGLMEVLENALAERKQAERRDSIRSRDEKILRKSLSDARRLLERHIRHFEANNNEELRLYLDTQEFLNSGK